MPVLLMHFRTAFLRFNGIYNFEDLGNIEKQIDKWILTGDVGVLIFFSISGFILSLPFAGYHLNKSRKVNLKRYFLKRLTRLEPPYIITLILFFFVHLLIQTDTPKVLGSSFLASLFYSHNWYFERWSIINPVAWSLEIEVQFYILVPLLTSLFIIKKAAFRRLAMVLLLLLFPLLDFITGTKVLSLIKYGQYFLVGFLVADVYLSKPNLKIKPLFLDIIGFLSVVLIFILQYYKLRILLPLVLFIVFIAVLYGKRFKMFFANPLISVIGGMCYITYLIHFPLAIGLVKVFNSLLIGYSLWLDFILLGIIIIPIVIIITSIAYLMIEKPFMNHDWPKRFWNWLRLIFQSAKKSFR